MRILPNSERKMIASLLVEGASVRSISRLTGKSKDTILKLLNDLGGACAIFHDEHVKDLKVRRLQADEIWSFIGCKQKNASPTQKAAGWGDVWTWVAIDADTKLIVSFLVGTRDADSAKDFIADCAGRVVNRLQFTTDALRLYPDAVEKAFGADIDYAQLQKIYGAPSDEEQRRYSPGRVIGTDMKTVAGSPDPAHVSTSYIERQNLSMRMMLRRYTRLTNAFSKKLENHAHSVALYVMYYNFCRVHQTLRVTPAMQAGLSTSIWDTEHLLAMIPKPVVRANLVDREILRRAAA
jgi:IS1 family transposase